MGKEIRQTWNMIKISRILVLLLADTVAVNLIATFSLVLRFELEFSVLVESGFWENYLKYAPLSTLITLLVFAVCHLYNSLWEFAGREEMRYIFLANGILVLFHILTKMLGIVDLPRTFPIINGILLFCYCVVCRMLYRMLREYRDLSHGGKRKRTLLIGAGRAGSLALREFNSSKDSKNQIVCIIDDDPAKRGRMMRGVRIVGDHYKIPAMVKKYDVEEIIFAIPSVTGKKRREILEWCHKTHCAIKILPGLAQLANGEVRVQRLRKIDVEDLLGRDSVQMDLDRVMNYVKGKVVLVTGGGGSIGSELSRQIAAYQPKTLILFDIYENNVYDIQNELKDQYPELELVVLIGSVRDQERLNALFEKYRPQIVYHTAAHKHVPLMEDSPAEAVKNNILGTWHVAQAAHDFGAETMVQISTDKAVNPTNVMGATKRVCEMIIQMYSRRSQTKFVAVRFGNVLGSNGSVIPLFRRQIEKGGPVTVTHKDIIRYFMTIPEAVSLVLESGALAKGGEIFVLDMGEPVRIDDLARNMIHMCGLEPDVDIEIRYTGLRPGEKLFEELLMDEEGMRKTDNELIFIGRPLEFDENHLLCKLREWEHTVFPDDASVRAALREIVDTYQEQEVGV